MYYLICKITFSAKFLYIDFHKINGFIKYYDGSKYSNLIPANEREKGLLIKYNEMFDKIKYLIKIKNRNSDDVDDKNKRSIFNDKRLYYTQAVSECF